MLDLLRARFRHLAIPGQVLAIALSLLQAMLWIPMWAVMLDLLDDIHRALYGIPIHWLSWAGLWATMAVRVVLWILRELLDLDLSDGRGVP